MQNSFTFRRLTLTEKEEQLKKRRHAYRGKKLNLPLGQPIYSSLKRPLAELAHDLPHRDSFQANICGPTDPSISAMPENTISPPPADLQSGSPYKTDAALRKAVSRIAKMQAKDPADPMKFEQVKERQSC